MVLEGSYGRATESCPSAPVKRGKKKGKKRKEKRPPKSPIVTARNSGCRLHSCPTYYKSFGTLACTFWSFNDFTQSLLEVLCLLWPLHRIARIPFDWLNSFFLDVHLPADSYNALPSINRHPGQTSNLLNHACHRIDAQCLQSDMLPSPSTPQPTIIASYMRGEGGGTWHR